MRFPAAFRGWTRLDPGLVRAPLPVPDCDGDGDGGVGCYQEALLFWMLFESCLRCCEGLTMHCNDVIAPLHLENDKMPNAMLLACSSANSLVSKTGL